MQSVRHLILGAGPTGLSLAYHLQGDSLILERESQVGGLCRSLYHDGGVFDIGGHSFHTPCPDVYQLVQDLLRDGLHVQQRDARVYTHGTLIPYPFQKFYDRIPNPDVVRECEDGLKHRDDATQPPDFEEYIIARFGSGVARHFMLPYNRKLWARDLKRMSIEWTSERVAMPKGVQERFDTRGGQRKPLQADTEVGYPHTGGFEEIYKSFVPFVPSIRFNQEVVAINPHERIAMTTDGHQYRWRTLISTLPIPELMRLIEGAPLPLLSLVDKLEYMSLRVEFLLVGHPLSTPIQRIYVADPDIPPHKIALNHNSSPYLRQQPRHAIMAETSFSPEKPIDAEAVASQTTAFLIEVGVLGSPADVIWNGHLTVKCAYPVYTHERLSVLQELRSFLTAYGILSVGRFGDWEYINSDKCIKRGADVAQELRAHDASVGILDLMHLADQTK